MDFFFGDLHDHGGGGDVVVEGGKGKAVLG